MDDRLFDLYKLPNISDYEDVHLLTLRENCAALEERVLDVLANLPEHEQYVLKAYLDIRDDLEVETVKAAIRFGKQHNKNSF